ncbi:MAG: type I glyceraldehyde-3-phosphate dehydrogenase [Rickettsiales bacterium]|nr:type I glyceraldehyde-3-phosphate dehydrogenase [Rickettsiales bacterium]RPG15047.1 MAG: type I glyceraldehyde-3-phosphate dehydrogenase [Pelagibacteraceae bacterium TMED195]
MKYKIAINGFGRIGRLTLRALLDKDPKNIEVVAVNDLGPIDSNLHLLKYDSIHGFFDKKFDVIDNKLRFEKNEILFLKESDPEKLNWNKYNIDLVIECTGIFTRRDDAEKHLKSGAKRVLISAPATNPDITVVCGINENKINDSHKIISNGSCTTNCLAPLAFLIEKNIGIESGYMTTVHSVTGDQNTIDTFHKDLRRARNSLLSMIPTSTGAARAVSEVLPILKGKLDGSAIRVPTANVSLVDFSFMAKKNTSENELNRIFKNAEKNELKGIVETISTPLVSSDFNHNSHSSIVDLTETKVINERFCRILSWYDNEWGFSNRLVDIVLELSNENL